MTMASLFTSTRHYSIILYKYHSLSSQWSLKVTHGFSTQWNSVECDRSPSLTQRFQHNENDHGPLRPSTPQLRLKIIAPNRQSITIIFEFNRNDTDDTDVLMKGKYVINWNETKRRVFLWKENICSPHFSDCAFIASVGYSKGTRSERRVKHILLRTLVIDVQKNATQKKWRAGRTRMKKKANPSTGGQS